MVSKTHKLWIDLVKGGVVSLVACLTLTTVIFTFLAQQLVNLPLLLVLIFAESFLLYWFVFRGNSKKIKVRRLYFAAGFLAGYFLIIFLLIFLSAI